MAALDAVSQTCLKAVDKLRTPDYAGPQKQTFGDFKVGIFTTTTATYSSRFYPIHTSQNLSFTENDI